MSKWCKRGVNSKTNPEKETNATKYFFIKTVTFEVAVFCVLRENKNSFIGKIKIYFTR